MALLPRGGDIWDLFLELLAGFSRSFSVVSVIASVGAISHLLLHSSVSWAAIHHCFSGLQIKTPSVSVVLFLLDYTISNLCEVDEVLEHLVMLKLETARPL